METQPVKLQLQLNGSLFTIIEPITFNTNHRLIPQLIVPAGFETDLASIPAIAGIFGFPKLGKYSIPAIFHDYASQQTNLPLHHIDIVFHKMMLDYGVSPIRAYIMFIIVTIYNFVRFNRQFGWKSRRR